MSIARARAALEHIPPDLPRDEWVRAAMGAHAAGLSFEDFDAWSAHAGNYNARDCRDTWRSIKPGPVGAGTLFHVARTYGWRDDVQQRQQQSPSKAVSRPVAPPRKPAPGMAPAEVWNRCKPADSSHAYCQRKGISGEPLAGLRVLPDNDPLRSIGGHSMAGALVVPVYGPGGELQSLQLIPADSPKMNLPGASMAGGRFIVGTPEPGAPMYVCEGIGQAWACWQATGHAAVCCFGWGNVARVAADLRQRDASARLALVPDTGKETDAQRIATELACAVAAMPEGEAQNFDANDLAQRDGADVLAELLEAAQQPPNPLESHPLAQFVDLATDPRPPRWVLPGVISEGLTVIAGAAGVGKTTALLPLAMGAAGLHEPGWPLAPKHWRHVVYITEDVAQAQRVLSGFARRINASIEQVTERLHIAPAQRMHPLELVQVGELYRERFTRTVQGVELLPLIVLDTFASTIQLESENDNSEVSAAVAALKQRFAGLPVWLVHHVAKADRTNTNPTARGAGALEADTNQSLTLTRDSDAPNAKRRLSLGKTRFEPRWRELEIESFSEDVGTTDEWGDPEMVALRWGIARPADQTREEGRQVHAEQARIAEEIELRQQVREAVQLAQQQGNPLNRAGVRAQVRKKATAVIDCVERLLHERWLLEIPVPAKERRNPKQAAFLVNLSTEQHEALLRGEPLPPEVTAIPDAWKKPIPFVPDDPAEKSQEGDL